MASADAIKELEVSLSAARTAAAKFFEACAATGEYVYDVPEELTPNGKEISRAFHGLLVRLGMLVRQSPMLGDIDFQIVQKQIRRIDGALRLREFREWDSQVINDEDTILGITPAGFSEDRRLIPKDGLHVIDDALDQVHRRVGVLIAEAEVVGTTGNLVSTPSAGSVTVRPGTAFIMMMMDPDHPELEDVKTTVREEFARVNIRAVRADEIEHSGEITHRILEEIKNAEFLIADLTGGRPSVYYEIGYAHAIGKRVIMYRKKKERLHFDLAVHNCPEYANLTELREKLRKRLAAMTNTEGST